MRVRENSSGLFIEIHDGLLALQPICNLKNLRDCKRMDESSLTY
jgi:hypothetical protein